MKRLFYLKVEIAEYINLSPIIPTLSQSTFVIDFSFIILPLQSYNPAPNCSSVTTTSPCFNVSSHRCHTEKLEKFIFVQVSSCLIGHCLQNQVHTPRFPMSPFPNLFLPAFPSLFHLLLCNAFKTNYICF